MSELMRQMIDTGLAVFLIVYIIVGIVEHFTGKKSDLDA